MRHVPYVEERASRVWWVVRPSMLTLFKKSFPQSRHVTDVHPVPRTARFRTTTFGMIEHGANLLWPSPHSQYLLAAEWVRERQLYQGNVVRAGLCVRGDATQIFDRWRSIHNERVLSPLLDMKGIMWYRLDTRQFAQRPWGYTADVVNALDVVVSVDTGVAHLAGALGVPLILLDRAGGRGDPGPDERWDDGYLQGGSLYSRLTRIKQRDRHEGWADVITRAREAIETLKQTAVPENPLFSGINITNFRRESTFGVNPSAGTS